MIKQPFISFDSFDGESFVYREKDGQIFKTSNKQIIDSNYKTSFAISKERVKRGLEGELELLILNLTGECNLRCKYCIYSENYLGEAKYNPNIMNNEIAKSSINFLFSHSKKAPERIVSFYGGEPLLESNENIFRFSVDYALKKSQQENLPIKFALTTNGLNLNKWANWLVENNFLLFVSLDGPEEIQDKWRGKGTFNKIYEGIQKIREINEEYFKKNITFSSTFVNSNYLEELREFFTTNFPKNKLRVNGVKSIGLISNSKLKKEINLKGTKEKYICFAKEFTDTISNEKYPDNFLRALFDQMLLKIYHRKRGEKISPPWPTNTCIPGGKKLFVTQEGRFYPCEKINGEDFCIGNIKEGVNTKKVINLLEFYASSSNDFCTNCWGPRICGSCFVSLNNAGKIDKNLREEICPNILENLILGLKIYTTCVVRNKPSIERYLNSIPLID